MSTEQDQGTDSAEMREVCQHCEQPLPETPLAEELGRLRKLEQRLHEKQNHPDYEYETTETGRKSGESKMPEGKGWLPNVWAVDGVRNWERGDYTETEYWMRTKEDARRDLNPHELPVKGVGKLWAREAIAFLGQLRREYQLKIERPVHAVKTDELMEFPHGSGYYVIDGDTEAAGPLRNFDNGTRFLALELEDFRVLLQVDEENDLRQEDPCKVMCFVQARYQRGYPWCEWYGWFGGVPIDRFAMLKAFLTYG